MTSHCSHLQRTFPCVRTSAWLTSEHLTIFTHFDLTYIQTSTTQKKPMYLQTHTLKYKLYKNPNSVPFSSVPADVHTKFNYIRTYEKAQTQIIYHLLWIPFQYFHWQALRFKIFIIYSWFLNLHSLIFNPSSKKHKLPPYSGMPFHVPVCTYIFFVKKD